MSASRGRSVPAPYKVQAVRAFKGAWNFAPCGGQPNFKDVSSIIKIFPFGSKMNFVVLLELLTIYFTLWTLDSFRGGPNFLQYLYLFLCSSNISYQISFVHAT